METGPLSPARKKQLLSPVDCHELPQPAYEAKSIALTNGLHGNPVVEGYSPNPASPPPPQALTSKPAAPRLSHLRRLLI